MLKRKVNKSTFTYCSLLITIIESCALNAWARFRGNEITLLFIPQKQVWVENVEAHSTFLISRVKQKMKKKKKKKKNRPELRHGLSIFIAPLIDIYIPLRV